MNFLIVLLSAIIIVVGLIIILSIVISKSKSFYKSDTKVSVIILNHERPHNLKKSIPLLTKYKNVDEIIILHSNAENYVKHNHKKVRDIKDYENNSKYYTLRRFMNTDSCKNNAILLLDDDIIPSEKLLLKMLSRYDKNPMNCYGPISRLCNSNGYYQFSLERNIVLSGLMLTSKTIIKNVQKSIFERNELMKEVLEQKGNGEDLLFQHIYYKLYNQKPIIVSGKYYLLDIRNGFSTLHPFQHYTQRNNFCKKLYKKK